MFVNWFPSIEYAVCLTGFRSIRELVVRFCVLFDSPDVFASGSEMCSLCYQTLLAIDVFFEFSDYFAFKVQLIGIPDQAEKDEVIKAVMDLKISQVEEGYTENAIKSRQVDNLKVQY